MAKPPVRLLKSVNELRNLYNCEECSQRAQVAACSTPLDILYLFDFILRQALGGPNLDDFSCALANGGASKW